MPLGADLLAHLRQQLLFEQVGAEFLTVEAELGEPGRAGAFGARRQLRAGRQLVGAARQLQRDIARVTLGEPVARLVRADVFGGELLGRLRDGGQQIGVALHLADRGVDNGVEGAVHQLRDEAGEVDLVDQRTGATRDGLGGRCGLRRHGRCRARWRRAGGI